MRFVGDDSVIGLQKTYMFFFGRCFWTTNLIRFFPRIEIDVQKQTPFKELDLQWTPFLSHQVVGSGKNSCSIYFPLPNVHFMWPSSLNHFLSFFWGGLQFYPRHPVIPCDDRCLNPQSFENAFRGSKHLLTHQVWLEDGLDVQGDIICWVSTWRIIPVGKFGHLEGE